MPISVTCQSCGQSFALGDHLAGRTVRCKCGKPLAVPDPLANPLMSLIDEETSRPRQLPSLREAPKVRPPSAPPPQLSQPSQPATPSYSSTMTQPQSRRQYSSGPSVKLIVACSFGIPYGLVISLINLLIASAGFSMLRHSGGSPEVWLMTLFSGAGALVFGLFAVGCIGVIAKWDFGHQLAVKTPPMIIGMVMFNICYGIVNMIRASGANGKPIPGGVTGLGMICALIALVVFLVIPVLVGKWASD